MSKYIYRNKTQNCNTNYELTSSEISSQPSMMCLLPSLCEYFCVTVQHFLFWDDEVVGFDSICLDRNAQLSYTASLLFLK